MAKRIVLRKSWIRRLLMRCAVQYFLLQRWLMSTLFLHIIMLYSWIFPVPIFHKNEKRFRFESAWLNHDDCDSLVSNLWNASVSLNL